MPADIIPSRVLAQRERLGDAPAYHTKVGGAWQATSWRTFVDDIRKVARGFIALGLEPGQVVCILGFNKPEWVVADHAAMCVGGVGTGIYTTSSPAEIAYIVNHSEAPILVLETAEQFARVAQVRDQLTKLKHVVMFRGVKVDDPLAMTWDELLAKAESVPDAEVDARVAAIQTGQLAQLIYTSGTTGPPKGVMLSHENLAWTANVALHIGQMKRDDAGISYLPLSHIAEQMFTIHGPATAGTQVYYAESIEKLRDNLQETQPTILFAVPRVWEKMYSTATQRFAEVKGLQKTALTWSMGVASRVTALRNAGQPVGGLLALQARLADRVLGRVRTMMGLSRARFCVSGAAPINAEVLEFFGGLGVTILEVYGQSEDSGPTSFNQHGRTRYGTVGPAIPGIEVKIADDGEIVVKGPNVFMGYYKEPEATAETLKDGWLHSGDLGSFDKDGFLSITGRKKEIIITAGGKNVAPKNIEAELKRCPLVTEAVVIGDRRRFLCALLVVDDEIAKKFVADGGGTVTGDVKQHPLVTAEIQKAVDRTNAEFARVEQVREWRVLPRPLTIGDGELTPTLKVKRKRVEASFAAILDEIYAERAAT